MKKSFGIMRNPFSSRENAHSDKEDSIVNEELPHSDSRGHSFDEAGARNGDYREYPFPDNNNRGNTETFIDNLTGYPIINNPAAKSITVINADAQITGDLMTQDDLNMMGIIEGNVEIQGNMNMSGTITGNIVAGSATITGGKIEGDFFNSEGNVKIEEGAALQCNVAAGSLETSGSIVGDIEVQDGVVINATASVNGNITSRYITIKEGARINGNLKIGDF